MHHSPLVSTGPRALNKNALADFRGRERSPVGGVGANNVERFETGAHLLSPKTQELAPETGSPLPFDKNFLPRVRISDGNRPETGSALHDIASPDSAGPARPRERKIP